MTDGFKLYTVSTSKSIDDIYNILLGKAPSILDIGPIRDAFRRERVTGKYKKINKKFVLTTDAVYSGMKSSGYCDVNNKELYMAEYEIRDDNRPPEDSVMHYYFPPSKETEDDVRDKLNFLKKMKLLNEEDYSIHDGIVEFHDKVPELTRISLKILIDTPFCRVSWCRAKAFNSVTKKFTHQ